MPIVRITCPHCSYSRPYDRSQIPAGKRSATCPSCRQRFPLATAMAGDVAAAPVAAPSYPAAAQVQAAPAESAAPPAIAELKPSAKKPVQQRRLRFCFTGSARDYFGIWIVNTLLKIVTCGIYSAWAKVRKRRFFYGNTTLDRTPFEYLADPFVIFKGWLIAAVFFVLWSFGSRVNPVITSTVSSIFFLAMPWLIVRSRIFNLRYSAHRNIRFTFAPDYRGAYLVFAGLPCLVPLTLGLAAPYVLYRQKRFLVENTGYGRTRCTFDAGAGDFYLVFLKALGLVLLAVVGCGIAASFLSATVRDLSTLFHDGSARGPLRGDLIAGALGMSASIGVAYLLISAYVQTALANLTWNGTRLRNSRFSSTLKALPMAWLYFSSALAILFSCGLLIPWATVRIARYRLDNLSLDLQDDQDSFLGWGHHDVGATGEEIGDLFGIEIGI